MQSTIAERGSPAARPQARETTVPPLSRSSPQRGVLLPGARCVALVHRCLRRVCPITPPPPLLPSSKPPILHRRLSRWTRTCQGLHWHHHHLPRRPQGPSAHKNSAPTPLWPERAQPPHYPPSARSDSPCGARARHRGPRRPPRESFKPRRRPTAPLPSTKQAPCARHRGGWVSGWVARPKRNTVLSSAEEGMNTDFLKVL